MKKTELLRVLNGASMALAVRLVNVLAVAITVPLIYGAIGQANYGLYAMALSFAMLLSFADFGFGSTIVNIIAGSQKIDILIQKRVSQLWWTLVATSSVALVACLLVLIAADFDNYPLVYCVTVSLACLVSGVPAAFYQRIAFAEGNNLYCHLNSVIGRVASLVVILVLSKYSLTTSVSAITATLAVPVVVMWIFFIFYCAKINPALRPIKLTVSGFATTKDIKASSGHALIQICSFLEVGVDTYMVGYYLGPNEAAKFDLPLRLFVYVPVFINLFALPIWPVLVGWLSNNNRLTISMVNKNIYAPAAIFFLAAICPIVIFHAELISFWINVAYEINYSIAIPMGFIAGLMSLWAIQTSILNAIGHVSGQATVQVVLIVISLPLKALALVNFGPGAMLFVFSIIYAIKSIYLHKLINKLLNALP